MTTRKPTARKPTARKPTARKPTARKPTAEVRAHMVGPNTVYLEWFSAPKGTGRFAYEEWESSLPKKVKYVRLHAADTGHGSTEGFWDKMGFDWRYDFGEPIHDTLDKRYEASREMVKGINGAKTPRPVAVDDD